MTNTQRNTTVIGTLFAIVLISGYVIVHKLKKEDDTLKKKNKEFIEQIAKFDKLLAMREKIENDYAELRLMLAQQSKVIAQVDSPAITYKYLLDIIKWMGRNINFDFSMSSNKIADGSWNEYVISGSSDFRDAANFIRQMEYQRALITLEEITIAATPAVVNDSVAFSIVFRTHISPEGSLLDIIQQKDVQIYRPSFVSFRPRMYETPPDSDVDPSLIRIDKAKMIGITESKVFIRDEKGIIHILSVGDRVAYGYLYSINATREKVVFHINQFGSTEEKTLYLEKGK